MEKTYCKNHPKLKANWRCFGCSDCFCEACVKVYPFFLHGKTASCLICKEQCFDFKQEAEKQQSLLEQKVSKNKLNVIRYTGFSLLCLPFLFDAIPQFEQSFILTDLKFLLIVMGVFWFGPLRKIDPEIKWRAGSIVILFLLIFFTLGIGPNLIKYSVVIIMMILIPLSGDIISNLFLKIFRY